MIAESLSPARKISQAVFDGKTSRGRVRRRLSLAACITAGIAESYALLGNWGQMPQAEALAMTQRAHELAPLDLSLYLTLGRTYYFARRYDDTIRIFKAILDVNANWPPAAGHLSYVYDAQQPVHWARPCDAQLRTTSGARFGAIDVMSRLFQLATLRP